MPASAPATRQDAIPLSNSMAERGLDLCQETGRADVGTRLLGGNAGTKVPADPLQAAEQELDDAIEDQRLQSALAEDARDMARAFDHATRMVALIRSRSPEHQDRLARQRLARLERSLDEGVCYFSAEGEKARQERSA